MRILLLDAKTLGTCAIVASATLTPGFLYAQGAPPTAVPPATAPAPTTSAAPPTTAAPVAPPPETPPPPATPPAVAGGAGESCRARADCEAGLKCVSGVCTDEMEGASCTARADCGGRLACIQSTCVVPGTTPGKKGKGGDDEPSGPPRGFGGTRGVVGLMLAGGPSMFGALGGGGTAVEGGLVFALKGGVLLDRAELGLEFSPVTFVPSTNLDPSLQFNGYAGYHIPVADPVSWPLRIGLGMMAVNTGDSPLFEIRADVVGVSILIDPILIDVHLPTFRFNTEFDNLYIMSWMFGVGAAWLPG